jgi:hypothetical protein
MAKNIKLGRPEKLQLFNRGSSLEIVRKWFGRKIVLLTVFAAGWDGFLLIWILDAGLTADPMSYFPLLHLAAGIGITYYVVAGWLNRTSIRVERGKLAVRHGPIPWLGNKELEASNLKQLYVKEHAPQAGRSTTVTYEVHAITRDDRNIKLVSGLEASEEALYIEQEIETYLGIEDIPVKGGFVGGGGT